MALALRLATCGRLLGNCAGRMIFRNGGRSSSSSTEAIRDQAHKEMLGFWARNKGLKRPLSPHLSIYKPEVTSMFSLLHRATGIAMTLVWTSIGIAAWGVAGNFQGIITYVNNLQMGNAVIYGAKCVLAYPLIYHFTNGMRHLAWDRALGFSLPMIYKTGWFVFTLSFLVTASVAAIRL